MWKHIYLWEDPSDVNRILGWALLDPDGETFDVFFQPELNGLAFDTDMYAWAEKALIATASAAGRKQIGSFWVQAEDTFQTGWLEQKGYQATYQDIALVRSLTEPIPALHLYESVGFKPYTIFRFYAKNLD